MNGPFIRHVEVLIGPLEEWRGESNEKLAIRIVGDGSATSLRIKFDVHKHKISTATPSVVQVYNLGRDLRNKLSSTQGVKIVLRAGWKNSVVTQLFSGSLLYVLNHREGADIVTNLMSIAGYGALSRKVVSLTFAGGTKVRDIVISLAMSLPGIVVDQSMVKIKDILVGSQGLSMAGLASEALDKMSRTYGFTWWIDNGNFHAVDDNKYFSGNRVKISYKDGFLLRAEPMLVLAADQNNQSGVSISSLFNPHVEPGSIIELESELNTKLNRDYVVHMLSHNGDTHSDSWTTHVTSWVVM